MAGSMAGKTFKFNPMLHNLAMPRMINFHVQQEDWMPKYSGIDRYWGGEQDLPSLYSKVDYLKGLRLGRIIQDETSSGRAAINAYRYGFRFLYNPTSISLSASRNDSIISDPQSTVGAVVSGINQNFQVISFPLLLNRVPDLQFSCKKEDYKVPVTSYDLIGLQKYGTHWDLEYLYRCCNGVFDLADRGTTSDIGVILASNLRLLLGPGMNYFGFLESVSWQDIMFTDYMVPTMTEVRLVFRRHVDINSGDQTFSDKLGTNPSTSKNSVSKSLTDKALDSIATEEGWGGAGDAVSLLGDGFFGLFAGYGDLGKKIEDALNQTSKPPEKTNEDDPPEEGGSAPPPASPPPSGGSSSPSQQGNKYGAPCKDATYFSNHYKNKPAGIHYSAGYHTGHDYSGLGTSFTHEITATRGGTVKFVGRSPTPGNAGGDYGNHVLIEVSVPGSTAIVCLYAHMHDYNVKKGQAVVEGQVIGHAGNSGTSAERNGTRELIHLHYEERVSPWGYNQHRQPIWGTWKGKWV